jgi:hypothetical protein
MAVMESTCLALYLATRECKNEHLENRMVGLSGLHRCFVITCFENLVSRHTHTHIYMYVYIYICIDYIYIFLRYFEQSPRQILDVFKKEINQTAFI